MGVCHSSHKSHRLHGNHHITEPDSPLRPLKQATHRSAIDKLQDATETTTAETDLDTTLPMSPDSAVLSSCDFIASSRLETEIDHNNNLKKLRKDLTDDSPGSEQPPFPSTDIVPSSFRDIRYTFVAKNTRKGRALQARLEKARMQQRALLPSGTACNGNTYFSTNLSTENTSDVESFSSFLDCAKDDEETDEDSLGGLPTTRYTFSSDASRTHRTNHCKANHTTLNEEFEATMNKGMTWAEVEATDKVLAVALSRQTPTLEQSTPPLLLAVSSQDGRVAVTQLLEAGPFSNSGARLGTTLTLDRKGKVRSLDFSPDGMFLAVAGDDGVCALVKVIINQDGHLEHLNLFHEIQRTDRIYSIQFCTDGRYLAIGGYDDAVAIYAVSAPSSKGVLAEIPTEIVAEIPTDGLVLSLDWSPDSKFLAIGGCDKRCLIVNTENKDEWFIAYKIRRSASVQTVKWSPQGGHLAVGANDVAIIDGETFQICHEIGVNGRIPSKSRKNNDLFRANGPSRTRDSAVYRIHHLCWSPTGGYLVVNSSDGECKLLETKSFSQIQDIKRSGQITSLVWGQHSVIAGVPHRYLAMGGDDNKVVILKAGIEVSSGTSSLGDDISSSAGSYLSSRSNRGDWVLRENVFRDVDDGGLTTMRMTWNPKQGGGIVHALAFSRGSKSRPSAFFAHSTADGMVTVRSTLGWKILSQLEFFFPTTSLAFSNGSRILALGGHDGKIRIVATSPTWSVTNEINADASINAMVFSKNNERLAVGTSDGSLIFLNPQHHYAISSGCEENDSAVLSLDWCTLYLACGHEDGCLSVYESDRIFQGCFIPVSTIECEKPISAVAFGSGGKFLVAASGDSVLVYSASGTWTLMHEINVEFPVQCLRWSPNGRHLAFSGTENQCKILDTVFWAEIEGTNLDAPTDARSEKNVSQQPLLSFSQDGRFLARACHKFATHVINTTTWDTVLNLQTHPPPEPTDGSSITNPTASLTDESRVSVGDIHKMQGENRMYATTSIL